MTTKKLIIAALVTCLSACATSREMGNQAFQKKDYPSAMRWYVDCAKKGEPVCISNVAYLLQKDGHQDDAVNLYTLAARFGEPYAIKNLEALGQPLPDRDLVEAKKGNALYDIVNGTILAVGAATEGYNRSERNNPREQCDSQVIDNNIYTDCRKW